MWGVVNSLPNDKFLDWSNLKAFADETTVNEQLKFGLGKVENIEGKGENAGYQHFLLFPLCFQKASFLGCLKSVLCGKELNPPINKLSIKQSCPYTAILLMKLANENTTTNRRSL